MDRLNQKITIVDYRAGNIGSVVKKLKRIGYESVVACNRDEVMQASKLILPGVGHFASSVSNLKETGMWDALNEMVVHKKVPVLGICLGMQLMARHSEEGDVDGFGWLDANVLRFNVSDKKKYKIPHIGWNNFVAQKDSSLFNGIDSSSEFYFVHSYYLKCNNPNDVLATTNYDTPFTSAVCKENIFGVQFHPEKSHNDGEKLLRNFLEL